MSLTRYRHVSSPDISDPVRREPIVVCRVYAGLSLVSEPLLRWTTLHHAFSAPRILHGVGDYPRGLGVQVGGHLGRGANPPRALTESLEMPIREETGLPGGTLPLPNESEKSSLKSRQISEST